MLATVAALATTVCCAAQSDVPPPGPLTLQYSFDGVSFRYPNNWIVNDTPPQNALVLMHITVAPQSAFVKKADGHVDRCFSKEGCFVTHGFFFGFVKDDRLSKSTDEVTTELLALMHGQGTQAQKNTPPLTSVDRGSCGENINTDTPYAGTETLMICTLRVGSRYIWTEMFSPTADWKQYKEVFSHIVGSFSAVVVPEPHRDDAGTATSHATVDTSAATSPLLTGREISQTAFPAMVTLIMQGKNGHTMSLGSGFFVAPSLVATNLHVVSGTKSGIAKRIGKKESLTVLGFVAVDAINDLAILEVNDSSSATLSITNSSSASIGDTIYALGSPEGFEGTFSQGIISGVRERRGVRLLQISAPISPGSSGGPILDQTARVVGISVAVYGEGQNLNFAVPSDYLSTLLTHTSALQPLSALPAASRQRR